MKNTKFKVDILCHGSENDHLLKAIANHNSGKADIGLVDLISYGKMKTAIYPNIKVEVKWHSDRDTVIVEDNGVQTLVITKIELSELVENDPDDLKNVL